MKWIGLVLIPFCGVFVLVGVQLIRSAYQNVRIACASNNWPSVIGQVDSSEVSMQRSGKSQIHKALISYSYSVGGRILKGNTIFPGYDGSSSAESAARLSHALSTGARIRVYYDSSSPSLSMVVPGQIVPVLISLFGGMLLAGVGIGFLIIMVLSIYFLPDVAGLVETALPEG